MQAFCCRALGVWKGLNFAHAKDHRYFMVQIDNKEVFEVVLGMSFKRGPCVTP